MLSNALPHDLFLANKTNCVLEVKKKVNESQKNGLFRARII